MQMAKKSKNYLIIFFLLFGSHLLEAQTTDALGTFTPYSLFGIGEIEKQGTAINRAMGGIGVGVRDNRFINYVNPASITARDTLSFMLDFGVDQKNFYNSSNQSGEGKIKSAYNTFNMHNIVLTAPIYKQSALIVGINPYSDVGYKFQSTENNPALVSKYGDIKYQKYGSGSVNQFFIGAAMNMFERFSLGAEFIYYFGSVTKNSNILFNSDASIRDVETGWDYSLHSVSANIGLQYFTDIGKDLELTVGAAYRIKSNLKGDFTKFAYAAQSDNLKDTILNQSFDDSKFTIPAEFSLGFTIKRKDKWMFGADYVRQNWEKAVLPETPGVDFRPTAANYLKAGFEYIPNKYDIRYYMKRVTYRIGAYYEQTYIKVNGKGVNAAGITLGMSFPIYRWYNGLNIAVDFGQRGSLQHNMVRERYVQFIVNISLHDIWFVKQKYQ